MSGAPLHYLVLGGTLLRSVRPSVRAKGASRLCQILVSVATLTAVAACDRTTPTQTTIKPVASVLRSIAVQDEGMGLLSSVALQVVAGLQDPRVRTAVITAMRDSAAQEYGLDLQGCRTAGVVLSLFQAAERRGTQSAAQTCDYVTRLPGLILHMDHEQLANWNPTVIPVVTAIAHPGAGMPAHLTGYRSPSRTIDLTAEKHLQGPILVVFPVKHRSRRKTDANLPPGRFIHVDSARASHPHTRVP